MEGEASFPILCNDLEAAALDEAPDLRDVVRGIRGLLLREGAKLVLLSGSGSSVFGLFDDVRGAGCAREALRASGVEAFHCSTVTLDQFRRAWARSLGQ